MTVVDVDGFLALPEALRAELWVQLNPDQQLLVERAVMARIGEHDPLAGVGWEEWNRLVVPQHTGAGYAPFHAEFWEWTDRVRTDRRPRPFAALWPRGVAKSTSAEVAVVKLGCKLVRRYCLYVSHTQDQADDHVATIAGILESDTVARYYPAMADPAVNKHGNSKGWRRNRLRTAGGFIVDALGLDTAARGAKLDEYRPDMMVLDDIDATHASAGVVAKNIRTISQALLPALQSHAVVILAQNVVAPGSIAARMIDGGTDVLSNAIKSGPFPAVEGLEYERDDVEGGYRITAGESAWPQRMSLGDWSDQLTAMGAEAFTIECQQDTSQRPGAIWQKRDIHRWDGDLPKFDRIVVAIDPNKTGRGDDAGVVVLGRFSPLLWNDDGSPMLNRRNKQQRGLPVVIILADLTGQFRPSEWRDIAAREAIRWGADVIVHEAQGLGEHSELTIRDAPDLKGWRGKIVESPASSSKKDRARPVWRLYVERPTPRVFHAEVFGELDQQLTTWEPDQDPMSPGALDAAVHGVTYLLLEAGGVPNVAAAAA